MNCILIPNFAQAQLSKTSSFLSKKNQLHSPSSMKVVALVDKACQGDVAQKLHAPKNASLVQAVRIDRSQMTHKEWNEIENSPCVLGLEEDQLVKTATTDPRFGEQTFLEHFQFSSGYQLFLSPVLSPLSTVVVAVIDSGIDLSHPEFLGRFWIGPQGEPGFNFLDDSLNPTDDFGHGTHVAGLVGAQVNNGVGGVGVSAKAQLMVLKTQDENGEGSVASLISAIRYAVDHGAEVINMSLSVAADSPGLRDAIDYALERGVVIVAASGNNASEITPTQFYAPAAYAATRPGLISVGSVDTATNEISWFSNYSTTYVKIAAPGSPHILSTYLNQGYLSLEGTSMSSPIVAGVVAQMISYLKSHNIARNPAGVESLLLTSAVTNSNLNGRIKNSKQLDFYKTGRLLLKRFHLTSTGGFDD